MNAKIAVIIPTVNKISDLERTLLSLQSIAEAEFQTIVVQNGIAADLEANQRTRQRCDALDLQMVHEEIAGQLSGRHRGYRETDADILVFVDDDVIVSKTWMASICEAFQDPAVVLAGGPSEPDFESTPPAWLSSLWQPAPGGGRMLSPLSLLELDVAEPIPVDSNLIWGLNFAIRRSTLEACGGFHPDCVPAELQHFQGDGETGLTQQIAARDGIAIYHPGALVHHRIGSNRMTPEYFDCRYFYQGVCDSYTQVRMEHNTARSPSLRSRFWQIRSAAADLKRTLFGKRSAGEVLAQRFVRAYERGFDFHQACVAKSPILVEWIKRESYFDYKYPSLEPDFQPPVRKVHQ